MKKNSQSKYVYLAFQAEIKKIKNVSYDTQENYCEQDKTRYKEENKRKIKTT